MKSTRKILEMKRLTVREILHALLAIKERYGLEHSGSIVPHRTKELEEIEAILHEVVHAACLGDMERAIGAAIRRLDGYRQDEHELTTLRVEFEVFALLGHPLSMYKQKQLRRCAGFTNERPAWAKFSAPLSVAEEGIAKLVVGMIRRAVTALDPI